MPPVMYKRLTYQANWLEKLPTSIINLKKCIKSDLLRNKRFRKFFTPSIKKYWFVMKRRNQNHYESINWHDFIDSMKVKICQLSLF